MAIAHLVVGEVSDHGSAEYTAAAVVVAVVVVAAVVVAAVVVAAVGGAVRYLVMCLLHTRVGFSCSPHLPLLASDSSVGSQSRHDW